MANHGGMSFIAEQVCLMSCLFSFFSDFKENADFTKFTCLSLHLFFYNASGICIVFTVIL